jgi:AcrR family transcriptional regulator
MSRQKRDAEASKAKIIYKSKMLFSKKGFDATTIDDIAEASEVNKALIYYYFQNKAGLYTEVMSGLFDTIYDEVKATQNHAKNIEEELENFIKTYADYAFTNPYFPALLLRELSDSGAHLPEMIFVSMRKLFILLSDILKRGEEHGIFCHSIAMVVHFMIIGSLNLMVTTQTLRKKAVVADATLDTCSECSVDEIAQYIFQTVKKSLEVK